LGFGGVSSAIHPSIGKTNIKIFENGIRRIPLFELEEEKT
jgi:hypothetical protein